jgi:hypothetical protein
MAKIQHIYTVVREFEVNSAKDLKEEKSIFRGIQDEAGEYLYGGQGSTSNETITVEMKVIK